MTVIRRNARIPRGVGVIINAVQADDIPCMILPVDISLSDAADITAIHTEFKQKSVKKRRIALADSEIQNKRIIRAMLVIFRLFFIIVVVFDVSANIIVNAFDLFIIALIPKIEFIQKLRNGCVHLRFHFGRGDPRHRIFDLKIESFCILSVRIRIRYGTAVMLDIVTLIALARMRKRIVIKRGNLGGIQIHAIDAKADA